MRSLFDAAVSNKAELATGNRGIISGRGLSQGRSKPPTSQHFSSHATLPVTRMLLPASSPASSAVMHQTGMRDLDFLDGPHLDKISGFQLWQSRPSALSAFALSAVGPCQQSSNLDVTSHPLHLTACHHRLPFFHSAFFTHPPSRLQRPFYPALLFSHASALPLTGPWKLPTYSPCVALPEAGRCKYGPISSPAFFVRPKVGTKRIRIVPTRLAIPFPSQVGWCSGLRTSANRRTNPLRPHTQPLPASLDCPHRCSVTAWPWRRPAMFRFRMYRLPPASASCEALRRETRDPKRFFWAVVTVDAALADNTTPRQPTGYLTMPSGGRGHGAGAGVQHVCFVVRSNERST